MPTFDNVTTKDSKQIWASPDGQRVIYEVTLELDGKEMKAKTYSEAITQVGRVGAIETYEKPGKKGVETFVKQPPKDGGAWSAGGGNNSQEKSTTTSATSSPAGRNDSHIRAQWAIGQAIVMVGAGMVEYVDESSLESQAINLFHMVDRVKDSESPKKAAEAPSDEQMQQELDNFMNDSTPINLGSDPWKSS